MQTKQFNQTPIGNGNHQLRSVLLLVPPSGKRYLQRVRRQVLSAPNFAIPHFARSQFPPPLPPPYAFIAGDRPDPYPPSDGPRATPPHATPRGLEARHAASAPPPYAALLEVRGNPRPALRPHGPRPAPRESLEGGGGVPLPPNAPALTLPQRHSHTPIPAPTASPTASNRPPTASHPP